MLCALALPLPAFSPAPAADPGRVARLPDRAVTIDLHDDTTRMIVEEGRRGPH